MSTVADPNIDLSALEFWARPYEERERAFRWLRDNDPVSWHRPPEPLAPGLQNSKGYWAIVRYEHLKELSRNDTVFSSAEGVFLDDFPQLETILSFIVMDDPRHKALRGITQYAFSPRNIRRMEQQIRDMATKVVDEIAPRGEGDLCELVFKQLPGRVFAEVFVGLTDVHRREVLIESAEQLGAWADPTYAHIGPPLAVFQDAGRKIMEIAYEEADRCRREPDDNLMSWIVQANHEGQQMTRDELGAFFTLLVGAANDTSRHAMAHAVINLQQHPDQKALLLEDFEGRIDVAVIQSLYQKEAVKDFVAEYGQVIVDECHHISAFTFEQVMKQVKAKYVVGLTATPTRKDGHHPIIYMQCGPVRFSMSAKAMAEMNPFEHRVVPRHTDFRMPLDLTEVTIQDVYGALSNDASRNAMIADDMVRAIESGRSPLLLTGRTEHLQYFATRLSGVAQHVFVLKGGMGKKQRRLIAEAMASVSDNESRVILATGSYIGEGFDDARLDTLFLAMPISWKGTLQQYAGRLHRLHDNKRVVQVYDYIDNGVPMLARMYERRLRGYSDIGYAIEQATDRLSFPSVSRP